MHIDYAKEQYEHFKQQATKYNWNVDINQYTIEAFVTEREILEKALEIGSDKTKDIAKTILDKQTNKYFKVTDKMKYCIASDLLSKLTIDQIINLFSDEYKKAKQSPALEQQAELIASKIKDFNEERVKADLLDALLGNVAKVEKVLNNEVFLSESELKSFLTYCQ